MLTTNFGQATQVLPPNSSSAALDSGCGLGTVTAEIKKSFPDLSVLAIDSSAGMLKAVDRKTKEKNWKNVLTRLLDGRDLTGTPILHKSQRALHSDYLSFSATYGLILHPSPSLSLPPPKQAQC